MRVKDAVGRFGESVAAGHLTALGYELVDRNWRCRQGELDIVARDGPALVFVEVKTRSTTRYGLPAEAVDARKAARIRRLAASWLAAQRAAADDGQSHVAWSAIRFDVVSVVRRGPAGRLEVQHLLGAF